MREGGSDAGVHRKYPSSDLKAYFPFRREAEASVPRGGGGEFMQPVFFLFPLGLHICILHASNEFKKKQKNIQLVGAWPTN